MYQFDPQLCAACSETAQQQKFRKIQSCSIGVGDEPKRRIVNPQAGASYGNQVSGGVR
jgi:hypothetical protein